MYDVLPEGWSITTLGKNASLITDGSHFSPQTVELGKPIATVQNMRSRHIDIASCRLISADKFDELIKGNCSPQYGDVLFSKDGTIGKTFVYKQDHPIVLLSSIAIIRLIKEKLDPEYCTQYLQSSLFYQQLENAKTGSAIRRVVLKDMKELKLPTPCLTEQKKIAAILTSVDDVIEKTQAQIDKLQDLKTGMMQELLTRGVGGDGKPHTEFKDTPVGKIPKGWEVVNVGSLVDVIDPQPDHRTPPEVENGIPYVGLGDIDKSGVINFSGARKVSQAAFEKQCTSFDLHKGSFVFGKIGTIGNPSILPEQRFYCLSANVVLITGANYEVLRYIFQVFTSGIINKQITQQTNTTSQPALGIKKVREFLVPLPTHSEMKSLVNALSSIDKRLTVVKAKLDKLKSSKKALMQDLLTGKVRVKVDS